MVRAESPCGVGGIDASVGSRSRLGHSHQELSDVAVRGRAGEAGDRSCGLAESALGSGVRNPSAPTLWKTFISRRLVFGVLSLALGLVMARGAAPVEPPRDESAALFDEALVVLDITLKPEDWEALSLQTMEEPKLYAESTVRWGDRTWKNVGIKLKGSYGSFQSAGERPGLTLHFDKFKGCRPFAGLTQVHLNNGAQDDSRLHEWLGGELARAAGVPAGRCTHAWVRLQGVDRGVYVVREAFTPGMLSAWFGPTGRGELYDPGRGGDLDPAMKRSGGDSDSAGNLGALIEASQLADPSERSAALAAVLDIGAFNAFTAAEVLVEHWDGYALAANNYRAYRRPADGRFVFLAHGMDQILGDTDSPLYPGFHGRVAAALREIPGQPEAWAAEVRRQVDTVWSREDWQSRIQTRATKLAEAIEVHDASLASTLRELGSDLARRFGERLAYQRPAVRHPPRALPHARSGPILLADGWHPDRDPHPQMSFQVPTEAARSWRLRAESPGWGSWRQTLDLPPGRYRFSARVTTSGVGVGDLESPRGAGLRVLGGEVRSRTWVRGTRHRRECRMEFEAEGPVCLLLELRAGSGTAAFDADSLRLEPR